jgi:hypothetical protein
MMFYTGAVLVLAGLLFFAAFLTPNGYPGLKGKKAG